MAKAKRYKVYVKMHKDGYLVICNGRGEEISTYLIEPDYTDEDGYELQKDFRALGLPVDVINLHELRRTAAFKRKMNKINN